MRFLMMVKASENSGAPPRKLMEAIAQMNEEAQKSGKMITSGGLAPTAASTREFMELHRKYWPGWEGETEIRQMFGSEDYTMECGDFRLKPGALADK